VNRGVKVTNEDTGNKKTDKRIQWRTVVAAVLICWILSSPKTHNVRLTQVELKETIDKQQRLIDDLKRELEEMKQKLNP
jgi:cell division protein FtsL